jgi:hypothetical protein
MFGKIRGTRWLLGALLVGALECAGLFAVEVAVTTPAQAQFWNDWGGGSSQPRRAARPRSGGGFFQNLFGPESAPYPERGGGDGDLRHSAPAADSAKAPPPPRKDAKGGDQLQPTTSILVMGDGMADWLAYGLEDAFADAPEIAILRKNKLHSGLLRYDNNPKDDLDWWHVARDIVNQEKANYVVMMLGVSDRQNIRERDLAKEAEKSAKEEQDKKDAAAKSDEQAKSGEKGETDKPASKDTAEAKPKKPANGVVEFQSEQWERIYTRRIDDTIASLKSKGVPVFWVGLPPIRGTKSTAETSYLNNLYRQRAERAGVVYIDVWDGFVDEAGKFTTFGPDYEGQKRRLRAADGVYFTKYGARKLAHYVEREIRRYMSNRIVALPSAPAAVTTEPGKPAQRPLAGPVVPLTVTTSGGEELLGAQPASRVHGDATAAQVLVKGGALSPQRGRADDFAWPPGSELKVEPVAAPAAAPAPVKKSDAPAPPAPAVGAVAPAAPVAPPPPQASAPVIAAPEPSPEQSRAAVEPKPQTDAVRPKPAPKSTREAEAERRNAPPRPPRSVQRSNNDPRGGGLFGIFR